MIDQKAREIADAANRQWLSDEDIDSDSPQVNAARLGIIEGRRQAFEEAAVLCEDYPSPPKNEGVHVAVRWLGTTIRALIEEEK